MSYVGYSIVGSPVTRLNNGEDGIVYLPGARIECCHGPNATLGEKLKRHRPELSASSQEDKECSRYVRNLAVMRGGG